MPLERLCLLSKIIGCHTDKTVHGRKRLQKEVMLLQSSGLSIGYPFRTHFYGAYSEELFSDLKLLELYQVVDETEAVNGQYRSYDIRVLSDVDYEIEDRYRELIDIMQNAETTDLELGATYLLYRDKGLDHSKSVAALKRTKKSIASEQNFQSTYTLLDKLGLKHN